MNDNVVLQALHPSSRPSCLHIDSKSMILRSLKGEVGNELPASK